MGRTDDARIIAAKQDIATIMQALKLYKLDNQHYPTTEQGLQALVTKPTSGPAADGWKTGGYLDRLPKDPWGNTYQYLSPGIKRRDRRVLASARTASPAAPASMPISVRGSCNHALPACFGSLSTEPEMPAAGARIHAA